MVDLRLEAFRLGVCRLEAALSPVACVQGEVFALEAACTLEVWNVGDYGDDRYEWACIPNPGKDHSSHGKRS